VTQIITIFDTIAPVFAAPPADTTVQCTGDVPPMTSLSYTDNCDISGTVSGTDSSPTGMCPSVITRTWTFTDVCGNTTTVSQVITIADTIAPVLTCPPPQNFCVVPGGTYIIPPLIAVDNCTGNLATTYQVSGATVLSGSGTNASGVYNVGVSTITWIVTDSCGNSTTCTTTVRINPLPDVNAGTYAPVCLNSGVITLTGSPAGGTFSGPGVTGTTFNPATSGPGTHTITYSYTDQNGCSNSAISTITVNPLPTVTLTGGGDICSGQGITLTITFTGTPPFSFSYNNGVTTTTVTGITTSTYQLTVSPTDTTIYTITSISDANCSGIPVNLTTVVNVSPTVPGIRYPTVTATANVAIQLQARVFGNGYTYQWNPFVGLNNTSIFNPIFRYDRETEYLISITSPAGCTVVDTLLVKIVEQAPPVLECGLWVPKAWTPNRDGHNDKLYPLTLNIRELKYFRIFNRWGQLVFETNILGFGWDGIFKLKEQVSDTYTWTVEAVCEDGRLIKRAGNAVLIR
jgi:gliding motility-associated-like protein